VGTLVSKVGKLVAKMLDALETIQPEITMPQAVVSAVGSAAKKWSGN